MTTALATARISRSFFVAWLPALVGGMLLQGCADRPNLPVSDLNAGTPNPIKISRTQIAHLVVFPKNTGQADTTQMSALFAFVAANGIGPKDTLLVEYGVPTDQANAETVARRLGAVGLHPSVVAGANLAGGVTRVVLERYVAVAPDCPNWAYNPSPNYQNYNQRNFGCADARNLAAMVADPKDLAMGAVLGAQVGDPASRPVTEYRDGSAGAAAAPAKGGGAAGAPAGGAGGGAGAPSGPGPS